ncbi:globin 1 [Brevipalpus obovatus]|uniref:globin 1 n=1 Tax=Brevipalpus obovatus TaxID=246614 RepID=UPI003D9EB6F8
MSACCKRESSQSNTCNSNEPSKEKVQDDDSSLNEEDKKIVKSIWNHVQKDPTNAAIKLFIRFFNDNPSYVQLFSFRDLSLEQLKESKKLKAHASSVVYAISSIVDNLDDMDCCAELITRINSRHTSRGVTTEMYHNLAKSTVAFLKEFVGSDEMNVKAEKAWGKVFAIIVAVFESCKQSESNESKSSETTNTSTSTPKTKTP